MSLLRRNQSNTSRPQPASELQFYVKTLIFGMVFFTITYFYISLQKIPGALNKSAADTSVFLIGLSMLFSSINYYSDFLDKKIIYRKYLGIIGFAFGLVHIGLSFSALQRFFTTSWTDTAFWQVLTGLVAATIFSMMTLISNKVAITVLGGTIWRALLRLGYVALFFVLTHVVLLKSSRWISWFSDGMKSPPSMSLIIYVFIIFTLVMRGILWLSLKRKSKTSQTA